MAKQIAPVMTLYVELLTKIFNHVLIQDSPWCRPYQWEVLVKLASVCSVWRSVCLGEPLFWTQIGPGLNNLNVIHLFLQRSQSCPLTIYYYHDSEIGNVEILPLLAQHSERWLDVTLSVSSSSLILLSSIKGRLPLLEGLIWIADKHSDDLQNVPEFPGFEIAPSLLRSHLSSPLLKETIVLPWFQLTQLTCDFVRYSSLHSTLPLMPNLFLLAVRKPFRDSTDGIISPSASYPRLTSLEVEDCDFQILHSLLHIFPDIRYLTVVVLEGAEPHHLTGSIHLLHLSSIRFEMHQSIPSLSSMIQIYAPNLSELEFHSEERGMDILSPQASGNSMLRFLMNFLSNARCSLKTLKVAFAVDLDCNEMGSLFRFTPELEIMEISVTHGMECIPWRSMTPASQMLPKLKTFALHIPCDSVSPETLTDLVAFVRSNNLLEITFVCMD
ncbi:hypothetical protein F5880DRAFT_1618696 [Lentinula raphanica]|nr:hypothetical protein F5880DRAFT_1618696 [Lentinula raphanica]